jgi:TnpA family transposase
MIEGLLRHCTDAEIEANYTDTHGASVVGFAFCHLLGFKLLPRLKHIGQRACTDPPTAQAISASTRSRRARSAGS